MKLLDLCAECGVDFYDGDHPVTCSREEDLEMCGDCNRFYHNRGERIAIANACLCFNEERFIK